MYWRLEVPYTAKILILSKAVLNTFVICVQQYLLILLLFQIPLASRCADICFHAAFYLVFSLIFVFCRKPPIG